MCNKKRKFTYKNKYKLKCEINLFDNNNKVETKSLTIIKIRKKRIVDQVNYRNIKCDLKDYLTIFKD